LPHWLQLTELTQADIIRGDAVALAIVALVQSGGGMWSGTTGELFTAMQTHKPDDARHWPANERALGKRIVKVSPPLRSSGISPQKTRGANGTNWTFLQVALPGQNDADEVNADDIGPVSLFES
jgi:hypothetical protein